MTGYGSCQRDVCEESKWEHGDLCLAFMLEGRGPDSQRRYRFSPILRVWTSWTGRATTEVSSSLFVVVVSSEVRGRGVDRYGGHRA